MDSFANQRSLVGNNGFFRQLEADLSDAIRLHVRYETKDENGESRRERNERFNTPSPTIIVPDVGGYLWDWYFEIHRRLNRVQDGVCFPIPPSEFLAWRQLTAQVVYPFEYGILAAMDDAYCAEMRIELEAMRLRLQEAARQSQGA